ncbi:MAG: ECF transporter S component [Coriobacteriia bacterium]|nr:ECF transporter S component [Coriobacteriia bacterium]
MSARSQRTDVKKLVILALLVAIAVVLSQLKTFPLFSNFLQYDASGAIVLLAALLYGPVEGVIVAILVGALRLPLAEPGGYFGVAMDIAAYLALVIPSGLLFKRLGKRRGGQEVALIPGVILMVAVMIAVNIALTPVFWGIPRPTVINLVVPALLPFNLFKALVNSVLALALCKALYKTAHKE